MGIDSRDFQKLSRSLTSSVMLRTVSIRLLPMKHATINLICLTFHEHSATSSGAMAHFHWPTAKRSSQRPPMNCSISRILLRTTG